MPEENLEEAHNRERFYAAVFKSCMVTAVRDILLQSKEKHDREYPQGLPRDEFFKIIRGTMNIAKECLAPLGQIKLPDILPASYIDQLDPEHIWNLCSDLEIVVSRCKGYSINRDSPKFHDEPRYKFDGNWYERKDLLYLPGFAEYAESPIISDTICDDKCAKGLMSLLHS